MTDRKRNAGSASNPPSVATEPDEVLAPDEAPTPVWLPLLGIGLAVVGLVVFLATRPGATPRMELAEGRNPAADATGSAPSAPAPGAPRMASPRTAPPEGGPGPGMPPAMRPPARPLGPRFEGQRPAIPVPPQGEGRANPADRPGGVPRAPAP